MIRNEKAKAVFFDKLILNQREEVISWLRFKYNNLTLADAEDIFQEASCELWKTLCAMADWNGESLTGLLKVICRNIHSHWLQKQVWHEEWDDSFYPNDAGVETDYGFISSETARMMLKEKMYAEIDHLKPKDRSLMELYLQKVRMDKIARELGFRSTQVAKNRKSKIVVKLCKEINAQAANACASFFSVLRLCVSPFSVFRFPFYIPNVTAIARPRHLDVPQVIVRFIDELQVIQLLAQSTNSLSELHCQLRISQ